MSIVTEILASAQGGKLIENIAENFGLSPEQAQSAIEALTPALAIGLKNAATNPEVLEKVIAGVAHPTHQGAFDDPAIAHGEDAGVLGQSAVSNLFGSGSAAGQIAQAAAREAGLRPDLLGRLLPVLASVVLAVFLSHLTTRDLARFWASLRTAAVLGRF